MLLPFAARSCGCEEVFETDLALALSQGKTEMSAPLSIKKESPVFLSLTDMEPEDVMVLREMVPGIIDARRWSFPECCQVWR